ncbi:protein OS-9-like [Ruditapes philippinarum]|uniref:protein OS-9-like n=1 Tax=Ruditapes philippinarum TaxID=129788 RepID=UPI00295B4FC1|nr:protein OS-9-like [Ruditapes philippinarum]
MKTILTFFLILQFLQTASTFFDIDELKSFNYGIDIRNEPIVMKSQSDDEADLNTVHLTSKYGQSYQCSFPNTVEHEKQKEEAEKVAMETGIPDLLKPMESAPCLRKTKDWWSYEFCYGKQIKQFHMAEDGRIEGEIILLGHFESEYNWDEDSNKSDSEKKQNKVRRYHTQQYVNGSRCELNGKLRRTEIRFMCEEGSADYISRLDEPETCVYIMTIHTMRICHHPFLKPPTPTQTVTITCNPLLTVIQYQEYLDQLEAKEEMERLEEEKRQKAEEEERRIKEEKAKYFKENNPEIEEDGIVEVEDEEPTSPADLSTGDQDSLFGNDWSSLLKDAKATGDGSPVKMKTMYKVVQSPEDLKDFLKDTIAEMKKLKDENKVDNPGELEEEEDKEEEGEDGEKKMKIPKIPEKGKPPVFKELYTVDDVDEDLEDAELDELDTEIKTLKERYKNRRDKLTGIKNKVKSSMESQYESIIKEAKEELAADEGLENEEQIRENRQAIRQLTKTIDHLLNKLDKTEQEIKSVDKELEQIAEYDSNEKDVKSIPPVKDSDTLTGDSAAQGPTKTIDNRVKVRVRRINKDGKNPLAGDLQTKQTSDLEKSVQKELEKAGLGNGDNIQVKIITTGYVDGDDDTLHILSDEESETFKNMIVDMIGGHSEVDKEQARQDEQEENYSFVWGKNSPAYPKTPVISDGTSNKEDTIHAEESTTDTEGNTNTEEHQDIIVDIQEKEEESIDDVENS